MGGGAVIDEFLKREGERDGVTATQKRERERVKRGENYFIISVRLVVCVSACVACCWLLSPTDSPIY